VPLTLLEPSRMPSAIAPERKTVIPTEYDKAVVRSHNRMRRQRDRQMRQLPFLCDYVKEVQAQCELLKQELATARQQKDAFRQEALTLRRLIQLRNHPELATVAASEATVRGLREEVAQLQRQVQQLESERVECLLLSEEACNAAEYYQRLSTHHAADHHPGPSRASRSVSPSEVRHLVSDAENRASLNNDGGEEGVEHGHQLRLALESERLRSRCLAGRVSSLEASLAALLVSPAAALPSPDVAARGEMYLKDAGHTATAGSAAPCPEKRTPLPSCDTGAFVEETIRLQRFTRVLRCQNNLLTTRVEELAQRNVEYTREVAALKLACSQLRGEMRAQEQ
jgi:hypothetical protein